MNSGTRRTRMLRIITDKEIRFYPFNLCYPCSFFLLTCFITLLFIQCGEKKESAIPLYASLNDTVKYVGMQMCRQCHADKFETFMHTGMGMSFDKEIGRAHA